MLEALDTTTCTDRPSAARPAHNGCPPGSRGSSSRRRGCHFAVTPSMFLLKCLVKGEGVQQNDRRSLTALGSSGVKPPAAHPRYHRGPRFALPAEREQMLRHLAEEGYVRLGLAPPSPRSFTHTHSPPPPPQPPQPPTLCRTLSPVSSSAAPRCHQATGSTHSYSVGHSPRA